MKKRQPEHTARVGNAVAIVSGDVLLVLSVAVTVLYRNSEMWWGRC